MTLNQALGGRIYHSCGDAAVEIKLAYGFLRNRKNAARIVEEQKKEESRKEYYDEWLKENLTLDLIPKWWSRNLRDRETGDDFSGCECHSGPL